jgi:flavin reductase (DIM6/NTAB) family NADH-FMN oxidoreductase RutF
VNAAALPRADALPASFRNALRGQASTVCVITAHTPFGAHGMTATAVMSLSVDPPALAIAINRTARMNPHLQPGAPLCVQLLAEHQADIARGFAGALPQERRFSIGHWDRDAWGEPVLAGAVASFSGTVDQRIELATHSLLIVQVRAVRTSTHTRPLLYAHGDFTGLCAVAQECAA